MLIDWLTQASCSGFLAGVLSKSVRTLQLCTASTSKGQAEIFEQWLLSIYRRSDGRRDLDMYEVTVRIQVPSLPKSIGRWKRSKYFFLGSAGQWLTSEYGIRKATKKTKSPLNTDTVSHITYSNKGDREAFTCLCPVHLSRVRLSNTWDLSEITSQRD